MKNAEKSSIKTKANVDKLARIKELAGLINKYNYEYYVLDAPSVSDDRWDLLYRELQDLERETGIILPESPTKKIGGGELAVKSGFKKHSHLFPLYSLNKSQSAEEVKKWFSDIKNRFPSASFTASYKFDGLALVLTYDGGVLKSAATRGNGKTGENVTEQVKTIKTVPHQISIKEKVEIGGEGMIRLSEFKKFPDLKNTRNAAAGAIRNLDPNITAMRNLDFFAYSLTFTDSRMLPQTEIFETLRKDFQVVLPKKHSGINNFNEIQKIIESITAERNKLDFDIDGIVLNVNEPQIRAELGYTIKFPRWAMAYKFEAEVAETKLLDIIWQVGRSGKVTPIAVLEPVELCGATVTRATLNNYDDILRKKVRIGETVSVRRSNDVIPEILAGAGEHESNISDIDICPSCQSSLVTVGANKFCPNADCTARNIEKFTHFVSRDCMNIEGLSDKTIIALINKGFLKVFGDVYRITAENLASLDGFKDKKINNLLLSIQTSRSVSFPSFINALGIPNIGKKASSVLASSFNGLAELRGAGTEKLTGLDEFGGIMADSIVNYFSNNGQELDDLLKFLDIKYSKASGGVLSGKKICITGTVENYSRTELSKILAEKGALIVDSVSKKTDVLIAGENCGSKLDKAKKLKIKIIEQNHLSDFLQGGKM